MADFTATDAKNKFGQILELAQAEPVHITKNGCDVAVLMSQEHHADPLARAGAPSVRPLVEQLLERSIQRRKSLNEALAK